MKFTFDRDAMIKEISIAQEIITNKSPVSILSNILIIAENNSLTIKATDSVVKFSTVIPVDIQEEGRTTIFCDKFMSILSSLPESFDSGKDIGFFDSNTEVRTTLLPGTFVLSYPMEPHRPRVAVDGKSEYTKKIVVKIPF